MRLYPFLTYKKEDNPRKFRNFVEIFRISTLHQFIMQRVFTYLVLTIFVLQAFSMDFGLRFNSHSFPLERRTSLALGNNFMEFDKEFKVGFHFDFYDRPLFGKIISIATDDGHNISIVASHQGQDMYMLGLVVDDKMKLMKGLISANPEKEDFVDVTLSKERKAVIFRYNNDEIEMPFDLGSAKAAKAVFGVDIEKEMTDVAPIEVRNARIFIDNVNTNWWDFKFHDSPDSRIDEIGGVEAIAKNPHWLIDDHTDWTKIYSFTAKDKIQTAFDPDKERFFIVGDESVKVWHPLSSDSTEIKVNSGFRPMPYSNHLAYDTVTGNLYNYNLTRKILSKFDFSSGAWTSNSMASPDEEPNYSNHAFAADGSNAFTFGGYGFYKFRNDLYRINFETGDIQECKLHPEIMPSTSLAGSVVDGKLYLFGGKGNISGRQELPSSYNYALYVYDTATWNGEKVWELDSVKHNFLPTQTMYYDQIDDCFYMASTCNGGEMIRISRQEPEISVVSTPIDTKMEYHDFVFDLFLSKDGKRYYLVIDKRLDPITHDYAIYTISAPFLDNPEIIKNKSLPAMQNSEKNSIVIWIVVGIAILLIIALIILFTRRRKDIVASDVNDTVIPADQPISDITDSVAVPNTNCTSDFKDLEEAPLRTEIKFFDKNDSQRHISKFDRSKSAISFLGNFNVRSKSGDDITSKFTDRLKSLLILLLLSNEKYENGIKYQRIDEEIWGDKDEKSAQNNRNVYMRKLRILLEEIGDVPITYEKGYFKIHCNDVMFDYGEALDRFKKIQTEGNASPELIDEVLDLLLMGPLLPMTTYEWLDQYKADYSDQALEILGKLLKYEMDRNDTMAFKIAQTISLHEPLSEEAMKAKCILLNRKKMVGQAQKIYIKFCKEYSHSLGEEYTVPFPDVCKSKI